MKEDLNNLIDGELPDEATAELLHLLSVDPEKRTVFRQQMKLQGALHRNESHGQLTASEQVEMLGRLSTAVGSGTAAARGWLNRLTLSALATGLILGTGLGFLVNGWVTPDQMPPTQAAVVQKIERPPPATPPVAMTTRTETFNRDSLVAVVRDSVVKAMNRPAVARKVNRPVRAAVKKPAFTPNDLTGRPYVPKGKSKTR